MKKLIFALLILLFIFPSISAIEIDVEKLSSDEVLIPDLDGAVSFDIKLINRNGSDNFKFYNLLGFEMFPIGTVYVEAGKSKNLELRISPIGEFTHRGSYTLEYYIQGQDGTEQKQRITFMVQDLEGSFEVGSGEIDPESSSMEIFIHNRVNYDFEEITARFSSPFFDFEETFELGPNERKNFNVNIDSDDFKKLMAGFYTFTTDISVQDRETSAEGVIRFVERDILTTTKKDYGFIISTQIFKKTNEGNVVVASETVIKKNIISRLFTSFSPEPSSVDRDGATVYYTWVNEINPGESLEISVKTNWLLPLLIIFFIVLIVVLAKRYSTTNIVLRKKVSFVRTKGADFGLKVSIFVHARKYVERVNIIDRLPPLVEVYEKFGVESPSRVNKKGRSVEWNFEKLEAGETRIITYIIYSKIGVMGRFALPRTTAIYERDGRIKEVESNKAFFVAEQRTKDIEE